MTPNAIHVRLQMPAPRRLIRAVEVFFVGLERDLGVNDQVLALRQIYDTSRKRCSPVSSLAAL